MPSMTSMIALLGLVLLVAVPATFVVPPSARAVSWTNRDFAYDGGDRLSPSFTASQGDVLTADLTVYYVKNGTVAETHPGFSASEFKGGQSGPRRKGNGRNNRADCALRIPFPLAISSPRGAEEYLLR